MAEIKLFYCSEAVSAVVFGEQAVMCKCQLHLVLYTKIDQLENLLFCYKPFKIKQRNSQHANGGCVPLITSSERMEEPRRLPLNL